ncbi:MAG TPA: STAS domain-containing protein [Labilithrix sp.]|nr:STAS domain-containing protein [Labilithrix sp.]
MTDKLLPAVVTRRVRAVILDMTGVEEIDQASLEHLGRMHSAVRLLGSRCVFTGMAPETASLVVEMGIELAGWTTFSTVRQALAHIQHAAQDGSGRRRTGGR